MKPLSLLLALTLIPAAFAAPREAPAPTGLMMELLAMPERVAIRDPQPEFSWIVNSDHKDDLQTAYQIRAAATRGELGKASAVWDSGRVASDRSVAVSYAGKPLASQREYWWQVRTWTRGGGESAWSAPQRFRTGALRQPGVPAASSEERHTIERYAPEQTAVAPVTVSEVEKGHFFLDFGRDAYAGLRLTITSPGDGEKVVVHMGEALEGPRRVNRKPGGSIRYYRVEIPLRAGRQTYDVPLQERDRRRLPPAIGAAMPFRYVEVEGCPGPLTRDDARQLAVHYPFDERAASFTSSDPQLNAVWELCRYSMKATSPFGVYVDGDRERLPYEADAYINQLGHYATDREFTLARYSQEHLILQPTWPTEWILHSVLMAWTDYLYTGDSKSLAEFYPDLKAKTLRALARRDGLISTVEPPVPKEVLQSIHFDKPIRDIVDWPMGERDGYEMRPVNTVVNAFHQRSLALMAQIAAAMNHREDAEAFRTAAEQVRSAINGRLFNRETGLYLDGEGSAHSSLHANMFPLAFGIVPGSDVPKVAAFVRSKGMGCSVYGAQYLMEALYAAGEAEHARQLITAPGDRSWRHMVEDVGTTISLEAWDNRFKPNQDWNHAWGAAPANLIPRFLMGVEPLEPGFRTVRIRPQPGGLKRASLDLPTIRGPIHVDFRDASGRFTLNVELPVNMRSEVHLPRLGSDDSAVIVDGKARPGRIAGEFVVIGDVGSGGHNFVRAAGKGGS